MSEYDRVTEPPDSGETVDMIMIIIYGYLEVCSLFYSLIWSYCRASKNYIPLVIKPIWSQIQTTRVMLCLARWPRFPRSPPALDLSICFMMCKPAALQRGCETKRPEGKVLHMWTFCGALLISQLWHINHTYKRSKRWLTAHQETLTVINCMKNGNAFWSQLKLDLDCIERRFHKLIKSLNSHHTK